MTTIGNEEIIRRLADHFRGREWPTVHNPIAGDRHTFVKAELLAEAALPVIRELLNEAAIGGTR